MEIMNPFFSWTQSLTNWSLPVLSVILLLILWQASKFFSISMLGVFRKLAEQRVTELKGKHKKGKTISELFKGYARSAYLRIGLFSLAFILFSWGVAHTTYVTFLYFEDAHTNALDVCGSAPLSCFDLHIFVLDLYLRGMFFDVMENFNWHLSSSIQVDTSWNPVSFTTLLIRLTPAITFIGLAQNLYKAYLQAPYFALISYDLKPEESTGTKSLSGDQF